MNCSWNGLGLFENRLGFVVNVYCKLKDQHLKVKKKSVIDIQRKKTEWCLIKPQKAEKEKDKNRKKKKEQGQ